MINQTLLNRQLEIFNAINAKLIAMENSPKKVVLAGATQFIGAYNMQRIWEAEERGEEAEGLLSFNEAVTFSDERFLVHDFIHCFFQLPPTGAGEAAVVKKEVALTDLQLVVDNYELTLYMRKTYKQEELNRSISDDEFIVMGAMSYPDLTYAFGIECDPAHVDKYIFFGKKAWVNPATKEHGTFVVEGTTLVFS